MHITNFQPSIFSVILKSYSLSTKIQASREKNKYNERVWQTGIDLVELLLEK